MPLDECAKRGKNTVMNTENAKLPDEAVPYILYQRTAYMKFIHSLPYRALRKISPVSFYKPVVNLEAKLRKSAIKKAYIDDMHHEYETMKAHLPAKCKSIVDIGCGVAGVNIFLQKHYDESVDFYLLDKTETNEEIYYLYNDKGAFYNSLNIAQDVLLENGIEKKNIHLVEATENDDINIKGSVDLIISLISWGFHYPVAIYLDKAYKKLSKGGHLIIDVRKETGGYALIKKKFGKTKVIEETETRERILAIKI